jgi:hypothetical protein
MDENLEEAVVSVASMVVTALAYSVFRLVYQMLASMICRSNVQILKLHNCRF